MISNRFVSALSACFLITVVFMPSTGTKLDYPQTISVLKAVYNGEKQAERSYKAYARKAEAEGYPNIAHFFTALSNSESIHARNFKKLLSDMGVDVKETFKTGVYVETTKKNLKSALQVELEEIDSKYPDFIEKIRHEEHNEAIKNITYAWESEMQHRDLIKKMLSGTGVFFGALVREFKKSPAQFFICNHCGSTILVLPEDDCSICDGSVSEFKEEH